MNCICGASKAAGVSFMCCLALEEARVGITTNSISLGLVQRDEGFGELDIESVTELIPVGWVGTPDEVGQLVVYLASDASGHVTGQTIHFNGGTLRS